MCAPVAVNCAARALARPAPAVHATLAEPSSPAWRMAVAGEVRQTDHMLAILGTLLVVWLVIVVIGFVVKGLVWLAIIGIVLFLATAVYGWIKRKATGGTRTTV